LTATPNLPYFDFLFALLAEKNASIEKSFGRLVHWGFWPEPARAVGDDEDYAAAAERLSLEVCQAAGIGDGERVLDAGCGFGGTIASLNERHVGVRLDGLNIDERQLERARREVVARPGNLVEFTAGDACALPYADESFDRVLAVECIFHFPSRERFLAEACRVLRPGGTLALTDFVPSAPFLPVARLLTELPALARFQYFGHVNLRCTRATYRRIADGAGLVPFVRRDFTRNTLPTYRYLGNLLRRSAAIEGFTERAASLVPLLQWVGSLGVVRYELLVFRKPGQASPNPG
jgi:ubiquinone/menaquinone biosynthesis C-methylase UbiE